MQTIQNIFISSLNGLSLSLIPLYLFQLLSAALGGYLLNWAVNKKWGDATLRYGTLIALAGAIIGALGKFSLPVSVMGAAVLLLLLREKNNSTEQTIATVLVAMTGVGCGVGSVIQTLIGVALVLLVILFIPFKK